MGIREHQAHVERWAKEKGWHQTLTAAVPAIDKTTEILAGIAVAHAQLDDAAEYVRKHGALPSGDAEVGLDAKTDKRFAALYKAMEDKSGADIPGILAKLALVHTEVTEGVDAMLNKLSLCCVVEGKPEGLASEMADVYIRLLQLAACVRVDLQDAYEAKMAYNEKRPFKHGKLA